MPSNEQRREAAKRKLDRQLKRRAQRARRRKQLAIAGSVLAVVVIAGAIALVYTLTKGSGETNANASATSSDTPPPAAPPPSAKAKPATVSCQYIKGGNAAKPVALPPDKDIKTTGADAKVHATMKTNQGSIGLTLDQAHAPCTVNSFVSLARQGFFDKTPCHRLVNGGGLKVLQCGDPTGTGKGGPGYQFGTEYPTDQYGPQDPALQQPVDYKRGVIAMANTGAPNSNGSQFFLVYGDSQLPPQYTIFGTIDATGLKTLDKVAAAGVDPQKDQGGEGPPAKPVQITDVKVG